jgi:hypothetical protein
MAGCVQPVNGFINPPDPARERYVECRTAAATHRRLSAGDSVTGPVVLYPAGRGRRDKGRGAGTQELVQNEYALFLQDSQARPNLTVDYGFAGRR